MSHKLEHDWYSEPLPDNVVLGERSWLYSSFAFRHYRSQHPLGLKVGRDTGLYNGTFFDLGPEGQVEIGDYCTLVGAIICSNQRVVIDDYVFIAHEVVLADFAAAVPEAVSPRSLADPSGHGNISIAVGENAWIGAGSVLLRGARVGEGAIVGAAAVVDFEVPPYSIVAGNPARIVSGIGGAADSR